MGAQHQTVPQAREDEMGAKADISKSSKSDVWSHLSNLLKFIDNPSAEEKQLLRRAAPDMKPDLPREFGIINVSPECVRTAEVLFKLLEDRLTSCHFVHPHEHSAQKGIAAPVDRRTLYCSMGELPRYRSRWTSPFLLSVLHDRFSHYSPERILSVVRRTLSTGDRFLFTLQLWPDSDNRSDISREISVESLDDSHLSPVEVYDPDPGAFHIHKRIRPVETPWGYIHKTEYQVEAEEFVWLEVDGELVPLCPRETRLLGGTYRLSGYQVERYLWRHGFVIDRLHIRECDNRAVFLARKQSGPAGT